MHCHDTHDPKRRSLAPEPAEQIEIPVRVLRDAQGRTWTFFERQMASPAGSSVSLLAEHENVIRRFDDFPPEWEEMGDDALLALLDAPASLLTRLSAQLQDMWERSVLLRVCDGGLGRAVRRAGPPRTGVTGVAVPVLQRPAV